METTSVVSRVMCVDVGGGGLGGGVTIKDSKGELFIGINRTVCILIVMVVHKYKGVNIHKTVQKKNHQCY